MFFPAQAGLLLRNAPACPEQYGVQVIWIMFKSYHIY